MKFLPSKEIAHVDGLSRLIPKNTEPLEETVIVSVRSEMDIKYVLFNTVKELPVMLEEIKFKIKFVKFINQTKKELINQKIKTNNIFSTCNSILIYGEWGGHTHKENFERFPCCALVNELNGGFHAKLHILAGYG